MDLFSLINNNKLSVPLNTSLTRGAGGMAEVPESTIEGYLFDSEDYPLCDSEGYWLDTTE